MLSASIRDIASHLGEVAIIMPGEIGERVDRIRESLFDIASQVSHLEVYFTHNAERDVAPGQAARESGDSHERA